MEYAKLMQELIAERSARLAAESRLEEARKLLDEWVSYDNLDGAPYAGTWKFLESVPAVERQSLKDPCDHILRDTSEPDERRFIGHRCILDAGHNCDHVWSQSE